MEKVTIKLSGGLGNFLFQISAAYSYSLIHGKEFHIDYRNINSVHTNYQKYLDNIFMVITFGKYNNTYITYTEPFFNYTQIPYIKGDVILDGYFQSEKYFIENESSIYNLFKPKDSQIEYLTNKYNQLSLDNTCSIHVRRGNYLHLSNYHPVLELDYYKHAISIVGEDMFFYILSDDIEWCKQNLGFLKNKIFVKENLDLYELYLISMCKNNINANSTFSWWGSWLNKNPNKQVFFPKTWFGPNYNDHSTKDLFFEKSIII
jgi:hypothetical protein